MAMRSRSRTRQPAPGGGQADLIVGMREALVGFGQRLASLEHVVGDIRHLLESQVVERDLKDWYDTGELADALGVSQHTVQARWCSAGRVECHKDPVSGQWKIPGREYQRLVKGGALRPRKM
jgi:hypothetical protein